MKKEVKFVLDATHPRSEYAHFNFEKEEITVTKEVDFYTKAESYFWSSKLGCSKNYRTAEEAVMETCRRHGVSVNSLVNL